METDERWKRPKAERTQPVRNWSTIFGPGTDPAKASAGDHAAAAPSPDPVSRAVELGYRVIDEYIRQGQTAARRFSEGGLSTSGITATWQDAATRMAQLTGEWMGLWVELAQRAAAGGAVTPSGPSAAPPLTTPTPPPTEAFAPEARAVPSARVRLHVSSVRPTEVALDLRPECLGVSLMVHSLRAVDASLPRITEVAFVPAAEGQPAVLSIRVPETQPPGTYSAVIVDAGSNRPAGTVSVRVGD